MLRLQLLSSTKPACHNVAIDKIAMQPGFKQKHPQGSCFTGCTRFTRQGTTSIVMSLKRYHTSSWPTLLRFQLSETQQPHVQAWHSPGDVAGSKLAQNQSQPVTGPRTGGSCGRWRCFNLPQEISGKLRSPDPIWYEASFASCFHLTRTMQGLR